MSGSEWQLWDYRVATMGLLTRSSRVIALILKIEFHPPIREGLARPRLWVTWVQMIAAEAGPR